MSPYKKILFIFGAGASRSINEKVPLMNDFFKKAADYLKTPNEYPEIWLLFAKLEQFRLFSVSKPSLENKAICFLKDHWDMQNLKETNNECFSILKDDLKRWIESYYKEVIKDESRCGANLENIFAQAEKQLPNGSMDRETAFKRIVFAIERIFCKLRMDFPNPEKYNQLSTLIKEYVDRYTISILSFNYDIWLERAMQFSGIWHPQDGYGVDFKYYLDIEDAKESHKQDEAIRKNNGGAIRDFYLKEIAKGESIVKILKPHGSLSWYRHSSYKDNFFLLLDIKDNGMVADNEGRHYISEVTKIEPWDPRMCEPIIVPPAPSKSRDLEIFKKIDEEIEREISETDIIIIIGWSMPETDIDHIKKIKYIIEHRNKQLQKLIVCDIKKEGNNFYNRFGSLFKPAIPIVKYTSGFDKNFIIKLTEITRCYC